MEESPPSSRDDSHQRRVQSCVYTLRLYYDLNVELRYRHGLKPHARLLIKDAAEFAQPPKCTEAGTGWGDGSVDGASR